MKMLYALILTLVASLPARAEVEIQEVTSAGGLTAWLVEEPSIPFVAMEVRFRGGASLDDPEKRGAINLMTGLLEEGAGDLDARGFAEAQEDLASYFACKIHRQPMPPSPSIPVATMSSFGVWRRRTA